MPSVRPCFGSVGPTLRLSGIVASLAVALAVVGAGAASAQLVDDNPAALVRGDGAIELYGSDGASSIVTRTLDGSGWSAPSTVASGVTSGPAAVLRDSSGTVDLLARGAAGTTLWRSRANGVWGAWQDIGAALASAPGVAVRRGLGYVDVAWRAPDNTIGWRSWVPGSGWSPPTSLPTGATLAAPAVVSYSPGWVHVFVRGTDDTVYYLYWGGAAWGPAWTKLPGVLATSAPTAVSDADGRIDVFVRGSDAAIYRNNWNGAAWSGWSPVDPTPVSSGPGAVALGPGRIALFARVDSDIEIDVLSGGAWSGWQAVRPTPPPPAPSACGPSAARPSASLRGRRSRTVVFGHGASIVGQALGPDLQPVAGALVHVLDSGGGELAQVTAGPDGRFGVKIHPGRSRTLRAGFRWAGEAFFACAAPLRLKVRAGVLLAGSRHVPVRGRIRLRGRLRGGHIPPRGKLVELQGWARGAWLTFRDVRTTRRGRFAATYRLRTGVRGTLRIRARVRRERGYPYALGWSRVERVHIR